MFLISVLKHESDQLAMGLAVKINGESRTLCRKGNTLAWTDEGGEHVRPILDESDDGAMIHFVCGDNNGQTLQRDGLILTLENLKGDGNSGVAQGTDPARNANGATHSERPDNEARAPGEIASVVFMQSLELDEEQMAGREAELEDLRKTPPPETARALQDTMQNAYDEGLLVIEIVDEFPRSDRMHCSGATKAASIAAQRDGTVLLSVLDLGSSDLHESASPIPE